MGKQIILWFFLTMIAIFFAMASIQSEGYIEYIYFAVAVVSCYGIRMFALAEGGKKNGKDGR